MLKKITESPYLNLLSGVILLLTSGYDIWKSFGEFSIGTHHGVAVFGLFQVMKSIPQIMGTLKKYEEVKEEYEEVKEEYEEVKEELYKQ